MPFAAIVVAFVFSMFSPRPYEAYKSDTDRNQEQGSSGEVSILAHEPSSSPSATEANGNTYNYNYYPVSESPPIWFQVLSALALLGFTGGLWLTSHRQWRAINRQADALDKSLVTSEKAAEAARLDSSHQPAILDGDKDNPVGLDASALPYPRASFRRGNYAAQFGQ
ncbi:MAG TPA: hypothetical protein VKS22_06175 [Candidatus Binataceae bacterium]|nr:hypothetical protein [Candidatus Binataceae bacterium]